ncbi:MAG TPA: dienelactone hydrolase family protein [Rhodanobacteraceae bacterium]|nr:dienelactone hydrolase family protein [Rhodanobacteraceae bacterium]
MTTTTPSPTTISTRDGACPSHVFTPEGDGPWPAVIVYMDALAVRPALMELGRRLADAGYYVLVPDLFYRSGPYAPMDPRAIFADPDAFKELKEKHMVHATMDNMMSDTLAFLDFLDRQPQVKPGPIGATGYCMGGRFALAAAGHWPERIKAAASFHGSNLATDAPDSPHLLAPRMQARILVAGATDDKSFPDAMKQRLETALTEAGVEHSVEIWPVKHGWVFRDTPVFDEAGSDRHYQRLQQLFAETLSR